MEKIAKYVERFMKNHNKNERYDLYTRDVSEIRKAVIEKSFETICLTFDYGYAKGYRAAMSEMMKKGGAI